MEDKVDLWLDEALVRHRRLTESVTITLESLLKANGIEFLAVSGRTKDKSSALEKIKRKSYQKPSLQMTDLSGIRVILYFESDVDKVSLLIRDSFGVDEKNSLDKSKSLSKDQIGYRSVHFVCTIGDKRKELPEYVNLGDLKFEVQVRTVLQHAWAELAHDSNYKFSGRLPTEIERKLYLYAGMLEIADKGFDELSNQIDLYKESLEKKSASGDYAVEIDSISLTEFFNSWVEKNGLHVGSQPKGIGELIDELQAFNVKTLAELIDIIPNDYAKNYESIGEESNIFGIVRDWMIISDWKRFLSDVIFDWAMDPDAMDIYHFYFDAQEVSEIETAFEEHLFKLEEEFG
ncbi:GTP pyrophosphokinase [Vibrio cholerae]|uniref:GTP pyrophosphokinase n=2 Tax=Vibrio TaxID=662 RepID=UPI001A9E7C45|nr:GTP pyrophosphokinase [Vibrio cholerae]MBO1394346.1 GTP pyrophosphokinase [Vibrio cholerae]